MSTLRISPCLAALALALPVAADTISVPVGTSLKAAVADAQSGDTLVLQAGAYADTGTILVDKSLTLIGAGSDKTIYTATTPEAFVLRIRDIDANEEVRVIGLRLVPAMSLSASAAAIHVLDCGGQIAFADVQAHTAGGGLGVTHALAAIHVHNAAQVSLSGCTFSCAGGNGTVRPLPGTECLRAENSSVWITSCTMNGGLGSVGGFLGAPGGPALHCVDSTVFIAYSSLRGGQGKTASNFFVDPAYAGDGAPGLIAESSVVHVRGGPQNSLRGGTGSSGFDYKLNQPDYGAGGSAAHLDVNSVLTTTPESSLTTGMDGTGLFTAPLIAGAGAWTQGRQRLAVLRTQPYIAALGGSSSSEVAGEPFGVAWVALSIDQSAALELPGIVGPIVLDLGAPLTLPPFALGPNGNATRVTPVPSTARLSGLSVLYQGFVVSPQGVISVSAPTVQAFVQ